MNPKDPDRLVDHLRAISQITREHSVHRPVPEVTVPVATSPHTDAIRIEHDSGCPDRAGQLDERGPDPHHCVEAGRHGRHRLEVVSQVDVIEKPDRGAQGSLELFSFFGPSIVLKTHNGSAELSQSCEVLGTEIVNAANGIVELRPPNHADRVSNAPRHRLDKIGLRVQVGADRSTGVHHGPERPSQNDMVTLTSDSVRRHVQVLVHDIVGTLSSVRREEPRSRPAGPPLARVEMKAGEAPLEERLESRITRDFSSVGPVGQIGVRGCHQDLIAGSALGEHESALRARCRWLVGASAEDLCETSTIFIGEKAAERLVVVTELVKSEVLDLIERLARAPRALTAPNRGLGDTEFELNPGEELLGIPATP
jgi:hypothetical protein